MALSNQFFINQILNPRAATANYWASASTGDPISQQPSGGPAGVGSYISSPVTNGYMVANLGTYISPDPNQQVSPPSGNYSLGIWARVNQSGVTASVLVQQFVYTPFGSGLSQKRLAPVELVANTWTWLPVNYTFPNQPAGVQIKDFALGVSVAMTNGSAMTGVVLDATGALFVQNLDPLNPYTGGYFDGSTTDVTDATYEWLGATNNSPSSALFTFAAPVTPAASPVVTPIIPAPQPGVRPRTFRPINLIDYQVAEDSTPVDPSDTTGATGAITMVTVEQDDTISLMDIPVDLSVVTQGVTRGTVRGLSSTDEQATITADSRLAQLVVNRQAQPFEGSLGSYFDYLLGLAEITDGLVVDLDLYSIPVEYPGWSGSVWDYMKKVCVANELEVSLVSNNVVVRPIRERIAETYRDTSRTWGLDSTQQARSVEIYYYDNDYRTGSLFYPAGGWNPDVEVMQVGAGETVTYPITFNASLTSIQQPVVQDFVARDYIASSVYSVSGNDGLPIPSAQWLAQGGSLTVEINEDTRGATVTIVGASEAQYAPYSIAVQSSPTDRYSTLRLIGTGVFYDKKLLTLNTSVDPDVVTTQVGATIDNEFITTEADALHAGLWALKRWGSPKYTITVNAFGVNRMGDNGSYRYPTFAEFNALYAGDLFSDFNTEWSGQLIEDFNRFMVDMVQNDFANQAFGNIAGSRVRWKNAWFRVRSATNAAAGIGYSAEEDTTVGDFNAEWLGAGDPERNFITNPSGRVSTTGYLASNGTISLSSGAYTQITTASSGAAQTMSIGLANLSVGVDLSPGESYVFSIDIESLGVDCYAVLVSTGNPNQFSEIRATGSPFSRVTIPFTSPSSGVVQVGIMNATSRTTGNWMRFRDARIGSTANYGDGNTTGWVWDGTPNASTSTGPAAGGGTIQDFNNTWSGMRFKDFAVEPLKRIT